MKKSTISFVLYLLFACFTAQAQTQSKSTAVVANPNVQGFRINSDVAAKMIRYELYKLDVYQLYDEFDMAEILKRDTTFHSNCFGLDCLTDLGKKLNVDYVVSGSFDNLSDRIVITIKVVDVKNKTIYRSSIKEFMKQEEDLQRMVEMMLCNIYNVPFDQVVAESLIYKNDPVIADQYGRINNTGPRMGCAAMTGSLYEFAMRPESQGGLDIFPMTSMLGYQVEWQYVGTDKFSALVECLFNVSGMEQGRFIPSFDLINGFRFGSAGWEIGLGPGFGMATTSKGFFDDQNALGKGQGRYFNERDWDTYSYENYGEYLEISDVFPQYEMETHYDANGDVHLATFWVFAAGRTFRAGSLNVPVNLFYTNMDKGGFAGASVGFNVLKQKDKQPKRY